MFGSRKKNRKRYTPPTVATVNPNAATAAVSAYQLSAAAAAAAIRALPSAPTNVAEVQTKRTMRRSASVSSQGSRRALSPVPSLKRVMGLGGQDAGRDGARAAAAASQQPPPSLRRRGSSSSMASMTERSFRSPSPHHPRNAAAAAAAASSMALPASPGGSVRSNRTAGAAVGKENRAQSMPPPPVPSIPKHHVAASTSAAGASKPNADANHHTQHDRKATSLGVMQPPLRLASQQEKTGQEAWFGPAKVGNLSDIRTSDAAMNINRYAPTFQHQSTPASPQDGRPGSRGSVNFSYPSRLRLGSPPGSPTPGQQAGVLEPASSPVRPAALRAASTERIPQQPLSHQRQQAAGASSPLFRRSASTSRVTGRPSALDPALVDDSLVYDPNSRRMVSRRALLMLERELLDPADQRTPHKPPHQRQHQEQQQRQQKPQQQQQRPQQHQQRQQPQPQQPQREGGVQLSTPPRQRQPLEAAAVKEPAQSRAESAFQKAPDAPSAQPIPPLSTSTSTPSSSVSSLAGLTQTSFQPYAALDVVQTQELPGDNLYDGPYSAEGLPMLTKRPSIVREEPEHEDDETLQTSRQEREDQQPQLQPQPQQPQQREPVLHAADDRPNTGSHGPFHSESRPRAPVAAISHQRTQSNSPVRTPHFAPVGRSLSVQRHSPPPRSISPRKSALKHSSPLRDASPSDSASDAYVPNEALIARKKSNRVSFDDKALVLPQGELAPSAAFGSLPAAPEPPASSGSSQPPTLQPQPQTPPQPHRRSWFGSRGRGKKKGAASLAGSGPGDNDEDDDDDDGEIMKPRPALPFFGSVREKVHSKRDPEERALVRPQGSVGAAGATPRHATHSPSPPPTGSAHLETLGTSSDHAIGSIIAAEQALPTTRNAANTSRYPEPLPPIVTSVEGSGYASESGASSLGDDGESDDADNGDDLVADSPVLRFDEGRNITLPAAAPSDSPGAATTAPTAPAQHDAASEQATGTPAPGEPLTTPAPKTIPAIAITIPSQESLAIKSADSTGTILSLPQPTVSKPKDSPTCAVFGVPGTFPPDTDSDSTAKTSPEQATVGLSGPGGGADADAGAGAGVGADASTPTRQDTFEPTSQSDQAAYMATSASTFGPHMPTVHEESSLRHESVGDGTDNESDHSDHSDHSSVYSDAYEDLSDIDGDGFMSLDAVVESPLAPTLASNALGSPSGLLVTGSPVSKKTSKDVVKAGSSLLAKETTTTTTVQNTIQHAASRPSVAGTSAAADADGAAEDMTTPTKAAIHKQLGGSSAVPDNDEDWDKVKAFWRNLTVEKRAQLEREALEEAGADGDREEEVAPVKKPRRKKSVEKRVAEKRALQQESTLAQQPVQAAEQQTVQQRHLVANAGPGAGSVAPVAAATKRPAATLRKTAQPPVAAATTAAQPETHKRTLSADAAAHAHNQQQLASSVTSTLPTTLRRRDSDSSESSFKRSRSSGGGGAAAVSRFRTSMRSDSFSMGSVGGAAATNADGALNRRGSRFSLRSLSPTGSATARPDSLPFRSTMRSGSGGGLAAANDARRTMSASPPIASFTLRSKPGEKEAGGGGFFASLGRKSGKKLLRRGKDGGGSGSSGGVGLAGVGAGVSLSSRKLRRSRFDNSSDDDDDVFNSLRGASRGSNNNAAARRSASASVSETFVFRSRFADSSDEDEIILDHRTARSPLADALHIMPKTLRPASSSGVLGERTLRSGTAATARPATARPASSSAMMPRSPPLAEELEEEEEDDDDEGNNAADAAVVAGKAGQSKRANTKTETNGARLSKTMRGRNTAAGPSTYTDATRGSHTTVNTNTNTNANTNIGTTSLRRARSGRGAMGPVMSPPYSPTAVTGTSAALTTTTTTFGSRKLIQRGALIESGARLDTQLERSTRELAAVRRSTSGGSRRRPSRTGDDDRDSDSDSDEDDEDDEGVQAGRPAGVSWPLPAPKSGDAVARATTDGPVQNGNVGAFAPTTTRKKKFPALRRLFRRAP
ncbi:hypothetical protein SPI_03980 [Niveomyces insectorum RCEF 264]|uniref:Uncharacterized protein n=1 Tax=Niveomyces insectorum RCEF 264 TaxID=1081102 RepID=A0A167VBQ5_9HYPO|nr:hypothetical protein SPI_03980 [Niveomyces insectorum RCEF 264]